VVAPGRNSRRVEHRSHAYEGQAARLTERPSVRTRS
jgi:hypothetical protein